MSTRTEYFKVVDKQGYHYQITLEHKPHFGFSTAYYQGSIVGQVELGRILEPLGDDDREWEMYEERYAEWTDEIKHDMQLVCQEYFNATR